MIDQRRISLLIAIVLGCYALCITRDTEAALFEFEADGFGLNNTFNDATVFSFSIDIAAPITAGTSYSNPSLNGVQYNVFGVLAASTPSGFPAFNLVRDIGGAEFYSQGSSLSFEVSPPRPTCPMVCKFRN